MKLIGKINIRLADGSDCKPGHACEVSDERGKALIADGVAWLDVDNTPTTVAELKAKAHLLLDQASELEIKAAARGESDHVELTEAEDVQKKRESLEAMKNKELKAIATEKGIAFEERTNKKTLVDLILNHVNPKEPEITEPDADEVEPETIV